MPADPGGRYELCPEIRSFSSPARSGAGVSQSCLQAAREDEIMYIGIGTIVIIVIIVLVILLLRRRI
jgi:hypothetical protein